MILRPQPGPQEQFLASSADIGIYGGGAGGGKSWALLAEPVRHVHRPGFTCVIFRRQSTEVRKPGGLWDESVSLYSLLGGLSRRSQLEWLFEPNAVIKFAHLEHEDTKTEWHGSQLALIGFDELTTFTESQFWYLLSRNRSTCGVRPYVRCTTNPDADSWVANLIAWWIDQETGLPIPERSGVVRWFVRIDNRLIWADTKEELLTRFPEIPPKSLTFVAARLADNPILQRLDPGYRANLMALPEVEKARLLGGNWKIRHRAGLFFKVGQFQFLDVAPVGLRRCRAWDLAATEGSGDWTVGVDMGVDADDRYYILDVIRGQWSADNRDRRIKTAAESDGQKVRIRLPEDPGQAGKTQAQQMIRWLAGYIVTAERVTGSKASRASQFAAQVNAGNVTLIRAPWNAEFLAELDAFNPDEKGGRDDQIDAAADAFNELVRKRSFVVG